MSIIGIVATLPVQAGKEAEFEKIFGDLRTKVKANEKGCLQYDFFKSKSDSSTYIVMEQYATQADLDAHGKTDYFRAAGPALGSVLGGAPTLQFLDKVE
ncbi:MAG TPA: antibiotic biosynthesis monooxygenase [Rhodobiaceae bacterium]|nr:antibiotic biosynthesis monooxygenase [Rhodobiaceae bacterium]